MIAKPMFNQLFTTVVMEEKTESGLIKTGNTVKDKQRVLAVGPHVSKEVNVGDVIKIDWRAYVQDDWSRREQVSGIEKDLEYANNITVIPPVMDVEGTMCLRLNDRDIMYRIEEADLVEEAKKLKKTIKEPKIVSSPGELGAKMNNLKNK